MATEELSWIKENRPPPFPDDFGERLERLKELTGLSWGGFAALLDVTGTGLRKWRRGAPPSGLYFWAILRVARDMPGGYDLMMHTDEEEEG